MDVETTGTDSQSHEIVEIGAVLLDACTLESLREFQSFVRPEQFQNANPRALQIHGLTAQELESAPTASEVLDRFQETFGSDYIFCGWNIGFDTQFLSALFRRVHKQTQFDALDYHKVDLWSLLELAWVCGLCPQHPKSLSDVCQMLHIERSLAHNALQDARIAAQVLRSTILMFRTENDGHIRFSSPVAADNV